MEADSENNEARMMDDKEREARESREKNPGKENHRVNSRDSRAGLLCPLLSVLSA